MHQDSVEKSEDRWDFFIGYTHSDQQWAEWIARQLEEVGYTCFIQAWDFRPGMNFVVEMDKAAKSAERALLVLSPEYLLSDYALAEWAAAFRRDPTGIRGKLLPVRVKPCEVEGLLGPIVYIDLVPLKEEQARERLLEGVKQGRVRPAMSPFPGHMPSIAFPDALPRIWNIPFAHNPFFTGREDLLEQLHIYLQTKQATAISQPQVISGLGGIGKTQLAVEYAYRYHNEYQYILWASAESIEALTASFIEIAHLLNLLGKDEQELAVVVRAVKRWLQTQRGWLLVLDNADSPGLLPAFLPLTIAGHLLLTTRAAEVNTHLAGFAHSLVVGTFLDEQGALFLLRRSGLLALDAMLDQAEMQAWQLALEISHELGGLPLALDQVGAYLKATGCSLAEYQRIYQERRVLLLNQRRGVDHPEPVATTWDLSFQRIEQLNPAAADLLRLCAFLAPDPIPEEIVTEGAQELGPLLSSVAADAYLLNQAIEVLQAYSLITRDPQAKTLTIHRLVQAVLRDALSIPAQQQWMRRTVHAVAAAMSPNPNFSHWLFPERLLPHALACVTFIEQGALQDVQTFFLLNETACYLLERAIYKQIEPLFVRALAVSEQLLGREHLLTATSRNNLAAFYYHQGKYEQAESLVMFTLQIFEQQLGPTHPTTALILNNLAELCKDQGKYVQAESLWRRALTIYEPQLENCQLDMAFCLSNLGSLYWKQGKGAKAEPLLVHALKIREQQLGPEHPLTAVCLNCLALVQKSQGKYAEAERLLAHALEIREQQLGSEHPLTAQSLNNLASLYEDQGKYAQAESLLEEALRIHEQQFGSEHLHTATLLCSMGSLYYRQGKYIQAEPLLQCALQIQEEQLRPPHPDINQSLNNLAMLYRSQGKYEQAELLLQRALSSNEQILGPDHPIVAMVLSNLALVYDAMGKYTEALPLVRRALTIRKQQLGDSHPDTATSLNNLAMLYKKQGKYAQAETLLQRALEISEQLFGAVHPEVATSLNNLALVYIEQRRCREAEQLLKRVLSIDEQLLGKSHPDTAISLTNLAILYRNQGKYEQAEALLKRALSINEQELGTQHSSTRKLLRIMKNDGMQIRGKRLPKRFLM